MPGARLIYFRLDIRKRHETGLEIHGQEPRRTRYDEHESESRDGQAAIPCRQGAWLCLVTSAVAGHGHRPRGHARHVAGQTARCRPCAQARREGIVVVAQDQVLLLAARAHEGRRDCLFRAENMGLLARHHHVLLPLQRRGALDGDPLLPFDGCALRHRRRRLRHLPRRALRPLLGLRCRCRGDNHIAASA